MYILNGDMLRYSSELDVNTDPVAVEYAEFKDGSVDDRVIAVAWDDDEVAKDVSAHQLIQEVNEAIDRYKSREDL